MANMASSKELDKGHGIEEDKGKRTARQDGGRRKVEGKDENKGNCKGEGRGVSQAEDKRLARQIARGRVRTRQYICQSGDQLFVEHLSTFRSTPHQTYLQ